MEWRVVYVKSKAEKKVAERLEQKGFEVFCPLQMQVRQWSDRKKKVYVPYFSSYVFVKLTDKQRLSVLQTPGVVNFVFWLHKPVVITHAEMAEVQAFFSRYRTEELKVEAIKTGDVVRVNQGVFKTRKGVVFQQTKKNVSLYIEQLGVMLKVVIPKTQIEKS